MRRSRAFILSEILMTMMLQAGFILVLCTSFYMLTSFYSKTQQVLTARSHAERVISFVDNKIRHAGLGLWNCGDSCEKVRVAIKPFTEYISPTSKNILEDFKLPVALMQKDDMAQKDKYTEPKYLDVEKKIQYGNHLTLLYSVRDLDDEHVLLVKHKPDATPELLSSHKYKSELLLVDGTANGIKLKNPGLVRELFKLDEKVNNKPLHHEKNIDCYAVTEGTGMPMYIHEVSTSGATQGQITVYTYGSPVIINAASELMLLNCTQMFVQGTYGEGEGKQFAFCDLKFNPKTEKAVWGNNYNQEKGILEIYMELNTETKILTLYVLASGGSDPTLITPRPAAWPPNAYPSGATQDKADENWLKSQYCHDVVYVSRASWKLTNLEHFVKNSTKNSWN